MKSKKKKSEDGIYEWYQSKGKWFTISDTG